MRPRHALADGDQVRFSPELLFFAQKARAVDEVAVPIQDADHAPRPARLRGRIATLLLGERNAIYVRGILYQWLQLRRSRRKSFWI
jgi:hypothetical protein